METVRGGGLGSGLVFFGFGGREFRLDSDVDPDFEAGDTVTFALGPVGLAPGGDRLLKADIRDFNDPSQHYALLSENLDRFPAYIRFVPGTVDESWNIEEVIVEARISGGGVAAIFAHLTVPNAGNHLWLGNRSGLYLYLLRV